MQLTSSQLDFSGQGRVEGVILVAGHRRRNPRLCSVAAVQGWRQAQQGDPAWLFLWSPLRSCVPWDRVPTCQTRATSSFHTSTMPGVSATPPRLTGCMGGSGKPPASSPPLEGLEIIQGQIGQSPTVG